jgi:predicted CopG family antitoxin
MICKLRNIAISQDNYQKLKTLGTAGDSFNDVISKVLSEIDAEQKPSVIGITSENRATRYE